MKKIAYYITTHGLGHATRSIAIIRNLIRIPDFEIIICSSLPKKYIFECFPHNQIKIHEAETLFKIRYKELLEVDIDQSIEIFKSGIEKQSKYIEKESEFCEKNNINLIISDICPFPFDVADKLKIPSIAISNFNWYSVFKHLTNENKLFNLVDLLEILKASYERADILLRLPFNIEMNCFKKILDISLVVRELTRNKNEIQTFLNLKEDDLLIFFGLTDFKLSSTKLIDQFNHIHAKYNRLKIIFSSFLKPYIPNEDYFKFIPENDQESQDYLAVSNAVIGKTGYGTVSECIAYNKPFIFTTRKDFIEDIPLVKGIEMFGKAKYYPAKVILQGEFENLIPIISKLIKKPVKNKISINGTTEVTQFIKEFL